MTNIQEQDKRKGGRPPAGRVRKLSKFCHGEVLKAKLRGTEAEGEKSQPQVGGVHS